jgi:hypothetical protein
MLIPPLLMQSHAMWKTIPCSLPGHPSDPCCPSPGPFTWQAGGWVNIAEWVGAERGCFMMFHGSKWGCMFQSMKDDNRERFQCMSIRVYKYIKHLYIIFNIYVYIYVCNVMYCNKMWYSIIHVYMHIFNYIYKIHRQTHMYMYTYTCIYIYTHI